MSRDLRRLTERPFDVLVVGAGIYGATIAADAALRGFEVALIDSGDFGSGTSANSLKTVHGGLRSLQRGALAEMREYIRERRALLRVAPHLVSPLTFLIPTERHPLRGRAAMRIALAVSDVVARDRNDGLAPSQHLEGSRLVDRDEFLRLAPDLDSPRVTGGALWHDAQMFNSERLVLAFVKSAARAGAVTENHVRAERVLVAGDKVVGAFARDVLSGETFDIRARVTINAAGPWAASLTRAAVPASATALPVGLSQAINIVTRRPAPAVALGNRGGGKFLFRVPWRGLTLYGTAHEPFQDTPPSAPAPDTTAVDRLIADLNRAFPADKLHRDDAALVHWGLLPSRQRFTSPAADVKLVRSTALRDHRGDGIAGFITVIGTRYTTARATAQQTVDIVENMLGQSGRPCQTAETPVVGGDFTDAVDLRRQVERVCPNLPEDDKARLVRSYGTEIGAVLDIVRDVPGALQPLGERCRVTRGEVLFAVRHEQARTAADVILRRTEAGSAGHPGTDSIGTVLDIMQRELGWDAARREQERETIERFYATYR